MTALPVLVTGGAGYIGSHVCKALAAAGFLPVAYDNLSRGKRWAVKFGPFVEGDLADAARLDGAFRAHAPAAVVHMAAFAYVGESVRRPGLYYRNNVAGSLSLLEAMSRADVAAIVFSSSCATYGEARTELLDESHPTNPVNPYGAGKLMVERMMTDLGQAPGVADPLRHVALRYFNAAGADPGGEIGEAHDPETHLIPLLLEAAAEPAKRFKIFGDDYDTPDGSCIRDFIHVSDLADAHVRALRHLLDGGAPLTLNLGTGQGISARRMLGVAEAVTGGRIAVDTVARRPGDPPRLVANATAAERALGWAPRRSDPETIIADAWRWHLSLKQNPSKADR